MTNCKYKLRKLSVGLVSVGTMLIAPTVLGQEVSTTGSTETSAASTASPGTGTATTSVTAASGAGSEATEATATTTNGGPQSATVTSEATPKAQAQTSEQPAATSASSTSSSKAKTEEQTPKAATSSTPSTPAASSSSNSNQGASTETEPQMMEVEQYKVDKEETELKVKDGNQPKNERSVSQNTKLIRNRDGEQRDIVDIKREVKDNGDGTLDVTLKVTPKEIDKGADVMALLDVSQKMTDADFDNAKEKIKKLVTTLTSKSNSDEHKHNSRNSVRLMTFYREISDPIDISGKTDAELDQLLNELREKAKANYDWGVDLQGAIHKAREIFNKEQKSKKRQHIVLFSQGESTFSYDIKNKNDSTVTKTRITEKVTTSNPLLPWPPIFDHTHQNADMLKDVELLISLAQKLGMTELSSIRTILQGVGTASQIGGLLLGGGSLTEYLTLQEYKTNTFTKEQFDYTKRVGEGYHYHSFSDRKSENTMPLENEIKTALERYLPKFEGGNWFTNALNYFELKEKAEQAKLDVIMKVIKSVFYKRQYHYYNHNLSAIAEAKMAQREGITFYSVDVTASNTARRVKRQTAVLKNTKEEERNKKFDDYLKKMSEGNDFLKDKDIESKDKFKDTLTELTIKDEFEDKVTVETNSEGKKNYKTNLNENTLEVNHTPSKAGSWLLSATKESLTWTISKEQLKKAFEDGTSLTLTYKLKVKDDKFKTALDSKKKRTKRDTPTENENSVTEKIISNTTTYKINDQEVKGNKLDDVKLTYTKETVPVPDVEGEVVPIPEKPLVEPMTPLYPAIPNYPTPQLPKDEDLEISGGHGPIVDIVEDTGTGVEGGAQNGVVSTQENKDPIVDITEDTQPGMSGSNDATVVEEDTTPKRPDVLVGGQSDPIDITEDTQPSVSGSNDATVVEEDTVPKRPDILVGGQSDPIDITEDTQPGMSGSNDATVIEEDTKPKRFFHFDNEPQAPEKPKEQPSLSLPQAPVYKAAHHLPASGDKREASFTIAALTIIGAAGLLSKKRRDTEEN
ncbi:TPA: serum opacification factor [Streptococcus pyogenes]|nr:serum opacification factor [Streptococcus pyogenes]VHC81190.1 serum opacity factor [Streptococcus pyogenes]HEQ0563353.1 fibronectin binding protein [Streptococcus pyogenes]HEQ5191784.1 fibronectin binding protein [Streptococcus pyogenes]HER6553861.1 fibronectin binding protein [Streptococcus pyogenes]HES9438497.1 VWA domain-containing protein [Streptococcus pyogenes]